jgi:hypothetical protein
MSHIFFQRYAPSSGKKISQLGFIRGICLRAGILRVWNPSDFDDKRKKIRGKLNLNTPERCAQTKWIFLKARDIRVEFTNHINIGLRRHRCGIP